MQMIEDSVEIQTTPKKVFSWFLNIDKNYTNWHPDHIEWIWIKGIPFDTGSQVIIKEYIHGKIHSLKCRITFLKQNELIEFDFLFPFSLIVSRGSFGFYKKGTRCIFTATLSFRFGKLFSRIFEKQLDAITGHMKEEGKNLKKILELG